MNYDASQIQILEGLEAVRKRPGMYIGSISSRGLHHLVYEIVDNSVDEALAGFCTQIDVTINVDNSITVVDNGRGIPVDTQKKAGRPALEVVFSTLHAGGKFGGDGYKVSGGLHGVGASVVNALSEWTKAKVYRDGKIYEVLFSRGSIVKEMRITGECAKEKAGTEVTFLPDKEIFEETVYEYDILRTRLRETAFLTKGLRIMIEKKNDMMNFTMREALRNLFNTSIVERLHSIATQFIVREKERMSMSKSLCSTMMLTQKIFIALSIISIPQRAEHILQDLKML